MNFFSILPEEIILNEIIVKLDNSHKHILSLVSKYFRKNLFNFKKLDINIKELMPTISIELLEFLFNIGLKEKISNDLCRLSAKYGNLVVLKWARENGCKWNSRTCSGAAFAGHLEILKWARENGCEWDSNTCWAAARCDNLEILKWTHENGCEWNSNICRAVAEDGHLEILKWACENGCES